MLFTNLNQAKKVVEKINLNTLIDRYNSLSTEYDGKITIAVIAHATAADLCKKLRYSLESILIDISQINGKAVRSEAEKFYGKYNLMVVISGINDLSFDKRNFERTIKNYKDAGFRIEVYTNSSLLKCSAARKLAIDYCKSEYIQFVDVGDGLYFKSFEKAIESTQRRFWNVTHSPVYIEDKNLYHTGTLKEMQIEGESFGEACSSCNPDYSDKANGFEGRYDDLYDATEVNSTDGGMNETTFEFSNLNKTHGKFKVGKRLTRYNSYIGLREDRFSGEDFDELNERNMRYDSYFGIDRSERYSSYEPDEDEFDDDEEHVLTYFDKTFVRGLARGLNNISIDPNMTSKGEYTEVNEDQIVATLRQPTVLSFLMNRNLLKVTYELMSKLSLHVNMGEDMITHFIYRTINNKLVRLHYKELREKGVNYNYREAERDIGQVNINWHGYYLYTSHMDSMCRDLDEYGKKSKTYENELKSVILFLYAMGYNGDAGEHEDTVKVLLAEKLLNLNGIQIDIESLYEHLVEPERMIEYHNGNLQRKANATLRHGLECRERSYRYSSYVDELESDPKRLIKVNVDG